MAEGLAFCSSHGHVPPQAHCLLGQRARVQLMAEVA